MNVDEINRRIRDVYRIEKTKSVRCATSVSINHACECVAERLKVSTKDVYSILISLGYESILDRGFDDDDNVLSTLMDKTYRNILYLNRRLLDIAPFNKPPHRNEIVMCDISIFLSKDTDMYANLCNIKVYTLNKYYVMVGLRELLKNDPEYKMLKESDVGKLALSQLNQFENEVKEWVFNVKHNVDDLNTSLHKKSFSYNEKFIQMNVDVSSIGLEFVEYEHKMDIGRVDILCKSGDDAVLVEVKKGIATSDAIGQVLKYVCTFNKPCKGMIVAEGFNDNVVKAANDLHIDLVEYTIKVDDDMKQYVEIRRL